MDNKLLEILCCPVSRRPVNRLDARRLKALNSAIDAKRVQYVDGEPVNAPLEEALVTDDEKVLYGVIDGIPVMLPEKGIGTTQFENFDKGRL